MSKEELSCQAVATCTMGTVWHSVCACARVSVCTLWFELNCAFGLLVAIFSFHARISFGGWCSLTLFGRNLFSKWQRIRVQPSFWVCIVCQPGWEEMNGVFYPNVAPCQQCQSPRKYLSERISITSTWSGLDGRRTEEEVAETFSKVFSSGCIERFVSGSTWPPTHCMGQVWTASSAPAACMTRVRLSLFVAARTALSCAHYQYIRPGMHGVRLRFFFFLQFLLLVWCLLL